MYRISIVEDEDSCADVLKSHLDKFAEEKHLQFQIIRFSNAVSLLENYAANYDLIFMDIRMPYLNGMEAAHRLRTMDSKVLLIFITNLAQYAIKGYEVDALDYVLKPVSYYDFALKMTRAMNRLAPEEEKINIVLSTTDGKVRLPLDEILYIETSKHHLIYHTVSEKTYTQYATLSSVTEKFSHHHFARCNSCYLVNLKYVQKVKGYLVTINGVELQISQPRKKEFIQSLMEYTERKEL